MTDASPGADGDRVYDDQIEMPENGTLAHCSSAAGYQTKGVGKLYVFRKHDRIGFDDVALEDAGRAQCGVMDDYEVFQGDKGRPGQQFDHGMSTDGYVLCSWHLQKDLHVSN